MESKKLLLVESNLSLGQHLESLLRRHSYIVTSTADAALALDKLAKENFGIVVLDVRASANLVEKTWTILQSRKTTSASRLILTSALLEVPEYRAAKLTGAAVVLMPCADGELLLRLEGQGPLSCLPLPKRRSA